MTEKVLKPDLAVDPMDQRGLQEQLVEQLREQIETGRIPAGAKLPPIKQFAAMYDIGENTVRAIMKQLDKDGLIVKRRKLGTYVRNVSPAAEVAQGELNITVLYRLDHRDRERRCSLSAWDFDFIHAFEGLVCKRNIRVSLAAVNEDIKGETAADQEIIDKASGFLVLLKQKESQKRFVENLEKIKRPLVICNYDDSFSGMRINEDWVWGTREILQHLQNLGHCRVALCSLPVGLRGESVWVKQREDAFISQAAFLGMKVGRNDIFAFDPGPDFNGDSTMTDFESGLAAGRALFNPDFNYTAIIAVNLKVADGLIAAAGEKGVDIPKDLSLVTYDDNDIALINGMTTIVRDKFNDAKDAVRLLMENIANPTLSRAVTIVNKPLLIIRDSTAPPRVK